MAAGCRAAPGLSEEHGVPALEHEIEVQVMPYDIHGLQLVNRCLAEDDAVIVLVHALDFSEI